MSSHFLSLDDHFRSTRWLLSTSQICNVLICLFVHVRAYLHTHSQQYCVHTYIYIWYHHVPVCISTHILCVFFLFVYVILHISIVIVGCQNPGKKQRENHLYMQLNRCTIGRTVPFAEHFASQLKGKQLSTVDQIRKFQADQEAKCNHRSLLTTWNLSKRICTSDDIGLRNLQWLFQFPVSLELCSQSPIFSGHDWPLVSII